jgi:hypothetical protein
MKNVVRNSWLAVTVLLCAVPQAFAQSVHRVPEGGSDLVYIALAGISCVGAVVYRIRK